jgi:hypothetical protein
LKHAVIVFFYFIIIITSLLSMSTIKIYLYYYYRYCDAVSVVFGIVYRMLWFLTVFKCTQMNTAKRNRKDLLSERLMLYLIEFFFVFTRFKI